MMKFSRRRMELIDLVRRIRSHPPEDHAYNAVASIQRLKEAGNEYWKDRPRARDRWNHYCDDLFRFLNAEMGKRRSLENQPLGTAMTEFIHEFEHHTGRIYQMLHASHISVADRRRELAWMDLVYRFSTYAILTSWTKPRAPQEATDTQLLRRINSSVTRTGPTPDMKPGSVGDTLDKALDEIKLIAGAALAWKRTHANGACDDCPTDGPPWGCLR